MKKKLLFYFLSVILAFQANLWVRILAGLLVDIMDTGFRRAACQFDHFADWCYVILHQYYDYYRGGSFRQFMFHI